MPISSRFVVNSTIILLTVGFLALLAIIGATIWLGENAQHYADQASLARDTRISAVELRSALQSAESSQRGFLVGGNEIYLAPYNSAKALAQTQFERLKASRVPASISWAPTASARASTLPTDIVRSVGQVGADLSAVTPEERAHHDHPQDRHCRRGDQ